MAINANLEIDRQAFQIAREACSQAIKALAENNQFEIGRLIKADGQYDEFGNFIRYAGGVKDNEKFIPGSLEQSHVAVPPEIAIPIRENRMGIESIFGQTFTAAFPDQSFLQELEETTGEKINSLLDFTFVLHRRLEAEPETIDQIIGRQTDNMASHLINHDPKKPY